MKHLSAALLATLATVSLSAQTTHELTNVGTTFSPPVIIAEVGDEIHLVLAAPHTFTEVSMETWEANGSTSNGGFNFNAGEHTFSLDVPGTIFYVCIPHAGMGMKGVIEVLPSSAVNDNAAPAALHLFPNPASNSVQLTYTGDLNNVRINVVDINGQLALSTRPTASGVLDVSSLPPGNFTVILEREGATLSRERLVIAR
jgi:plastocyanin